MNAFTVVIACACCGGEVEGSAGRQMVGSKEVCSASCRVIHFKHYQTALREAMDEVNMRFYG